jgi:hypothetical protein
MQLQAMARKEYLFSRQKFLGFLGFHLYSKRKVSFLLLLSILLYLILLPPQKLKLTEIPLRYLLLYCILVFSTFHILYFLLLYGFYNVFFKEWCNKFPGAFIKKPKKMKERVINFMYKNQFLKFQSVKWTIPLIKFLLNFLICVQTFVSSSIFISFYYGSC